MIFKEFILDNLIFPIKIDFITFLLKTSHFLYIFITFDNPFENISPDVYFLNLYIPKNQKQHLIFIFYIHAYEYVFKMQFHKNIQTKVFINLHIQFGLFTLLVYLNSR